MEIKENETLYIPPEEWGKYAKACNEQNFLLTKVGEFLFIPVKDTSGIDLTNLNELKLWFDTYYTQHEQKYRRLHTLNKLTDDGKNAYDALIGLYNEAEDKRRRIQEIEGNYNEMV